MTVGRRGLVALLALALVGGCRSTGGGEGAACKTCGASLAGRSVEGGACPAGGADLDAGGGSGENVSFGLR